MNVHMFLNPDSGKITITINSLYQNPVIYRAGSKGKFFSNHFWVLNIYWLTLFQYMRLN
jgi:hypothetical protein